MKKRFLFAIILLLLLSTYSIQNSFDLNSKLTVKKIIIENNSILKEEVIRKNLNSLYKTNFFLINSKNLEKKLNTIELIESFEIKKIYPYIIKIKIFERKPIAIIQDQNKKKYFTSKGEVIDYFEFKQLSDLPVVFGDKYNFKIFYNDLKKINFPFNQIEKFYLFESKRWDIIFYDSIIVRLPTNNYQKSLKNFLTLKDQINFEKYKIFDYRINNQLILK